MRYLSIADLYNLRKVNKCYNNILRKTITNDKIIDDINSRLASIFGYDLWPKMKKNLFEIGAVLSGSFIIQCILGEHWDESDIDLYIPCKCCETTRCLCSWERSHRGSSTCRCCINLQSIFVSTSREDLEVTSFDYTFLCNNMMIQTIKLQKKVQFIHILPTTFGNTDNEKFAYICKNFDFDICMSLYNFGDKLYVKNLDNILNRNIILYNVNENLEKRMAKYIARKFRVINDVGFLKRYLDFNYFNSDKKRYYWSNVNLKEVLCIFGYQINSNTTYRIKKIVSIGRPEGDIIIHTNVKVIFKYLKTLDRYSRENVLEREKRKRKLDLKVDDTDKLSEMIEIYKRQFARILLSTNTFI